MPVFSDDTIIDQYSALAHKAGLDPSFARLDLIPRWHDPDAKRRLTAYAIYSMYLGNVARQLLPNEVGTYAANETREQGDARLVTNRIVSGVVGAEPSLRLVGATEAPPKEPDAPSRPPDPEDAADEREQRLAGIRLAQWETAFDAAIDQWEADWERWPTLADADRWLHDWQHHVRYAAKVYESESEGTVPLGDGVLVMGYDADGTMPTLTVYEPDAYHPVLSDDNADEYPAKVHLAWEYEDADSVLWVRRITYELIDTGITRTLPWGESTSIDCHLTDMDWRMDGTGISGWTDLDDSAGTPRVLPDGTPVRDLPLGINWIPILHVPNTPSTTTHFGRSSLGNVVQLLDSIIAVDTDIERAAAVAGVPILGHEGDTPASSIKLKPGTIVEGRISPLDLSASLIALRELQQDQLERLSINSEVPGPVMGRVNANVVPSGVALALMHDPFEKLVGTLRLTREAKYPLLGKWAMRWAQIRGDLTITGPTPEVEAVFPDVGIRDIAAVVTWVTQALSGGAMSKATAVKVLQEHGVPIDDAEAELGRIASEDFEGAVKIADATGSEAAAAEYLGIETETPEPAALSPTAPPPQFQVGAPPPPPPPGEPEEPL